MIPVPNGLAIHPKSAIFHPVVCIFTQDSRETQKRKSAWTCKSTTEVEIPPPYSTKSLDRTKATRRSLHRVNNSIAELARQTYQGIPSRASSIGQSVRLLISRLRVRPPCSAFFFFFFFPVFFVLFFEYYKSPNDSESIPDLFPHFLTSWWD